MNQDMETNFIGQSIIQAYTVLHIYLWIEKPQSIIYTIGTIKLASWNKICAWVFLYNIILKYEYL